MRYSYTMCTCAHLSGSHNWTNHLPRAEHLLSIQMVSSGEHKSFICTCTYTCMHACMHTYTRIPIPTAIPTHATLHPHAHIPHIMFMCVQVSLRNPHRLYRFGFNAQHGNVFFVVMNCSASTTEPIQISLYTNIKLECFKPKGNTAPSRDLDTLNLINARSLRAHEQKQAFTTHPFVWNEFTWATITFCQPRPQT